MNLDSLEQTFSSLMAEAKKKAVAANRPVLAAASAPIPPIDIFSLFECHVFRNPVSIWLGPKKNPFLG